MTSADLVVSDAALESPINNDDTLYLRVLDLDIDPASGEPTPKAFKNRGSPAGMSTDWAERASPHATRAGSSRNPPERYGVVNLRAGSVRTIRYQRVVYSPIKGTDTERANVAHTDVRGPKQHDDFRGDEFALLSLKDDRRRASTEITTAFLAITAVHGWAVRLEDPVVPE